MTQEEDIVADSALIDPKRYRQVLGQYPTGVCVITARMAGGEPVAMVVGSFTSVSIDPPLVGFFPDRSSSSWAKLRQCETFCVNVLASDQEPVCRKLASKDPDKFAGTSHRISSAGNPVLDGVVAWVECAKYSITDAGDHEMLLGRIFELEVDSGDLTLLFFQGGYGRFAPGSLVAAPEPGVSLAQLRRVDQIRPLMEQLAEAAQGQCIVTLRAGDELTIVATAGRNHNPAAPSLIGQRLPFVPPTGAVHAAWMKQPEIDKWLAAGPRREERATAVSNVKKRGYSVGLASDAQHALATRLHELALAHDIDRSADFGDLLDKLCFDPRELTPDVKLQVRLMSAPVFDAEGEVAMALTLHGFEKPKTSDDIDRHLELLGAAATKATFALGGRSEIP
jgi:flavin reductase (DIM6/NTAB) family NADH-FMN oxidoreductase RutF/DNA-binding IclR family transcriptional regulator